MANFFKDNPDLMFTLNHLDLAESTKLQENGYKYDETYDNAPVDYADALDNCNRVLEVGGEISGDRIEPRSRTVDAEGPHFADGVVTYHPLTVQNLKDLTQAGLMGVMLGHQYGGLNFPVSVYTMMTEMVSRADASLQNIFGLQDIAETINFFGSEEQKNTYLPKFASGEYDGSMDLTEPDSGSDLQSVRLRAWQDEKTGQWYLNGMKRFITNGCAKVHLVLASSEEGTTDGRGLSMFICEACPQLVVRRIENKLGIHGVATTELQYNDVPAQLCGKRRMGLIRYVMSQMNGARVAISGQAVGIAEAAYREALKYANERAQFGKNIIRFAAISEMLSNMKAKTQGVRALLYETTRFVEIYKQYTHISHERPLEAEERQEMKYYNKLADGFTPLVKLFSSEYANQMAYDAIQIHGGSGFMKDYACERLYRDARIMNIYEGTSQLQVVAAINHVTKGTYLEQIKRYEEAGHIEAVQPLVERLVSLRAKCEEAVAHVEQIEKETCGFKELHARRLVEMAGYLAITHLLALQAGDREEYLLSAEIYGKLAASKIEEAYAYVMASTAADVELFKTIESETLC